MNASLLTPKFMLLIGLWQIFIVQFGWSQNADSAKSEKNDQLVVIAAEALSKHRPKGAAIVGDYIKVQIQNLSAFRQDSAMKSKPIKMELVLNGLPCSDITSTNIDSDNGTVIFWLDTTSLSLKMLRERLVSQWDKDVVCSVSVCLNGKVLNTSVKNFKIYFITPRLFLHGLLLFLVIVILIYVLATQTNIMRVGEGGSPFSLAQVQLTFWNIMVSFSVLYIWILTGNLPELPGSVLALLGISAATTAGSKFVSINIKGGQPSTPPPSKGFLIDILSDDYSTNIQRFQMVVWTLVLGIIFFLRVLIKRQVFDFDDSYLILTGISSGAYVLLKYSENKTTGPANEKEPDSKPVPPVV